jgi:hypothetical protein
MIMKQGFDRAKLMQIFFPFVLFGLGYVFSWTMALWIHEGGHVIGALLTGSQIEKITLIPPWDGQVVASYHTLFAQNVIFLGSFVITFVPFLAIFVFSVLRKSRLAYFMLFPLFMTFPSSWGDLKFVGLDITTLGAFVLGWFVPFIGFAFVMGYYNIWNSKRR